MTDKTRDAFEAWHGGRYLGIQAFIAESAWKAATKHAAKVVELMTERRRMNSSQKPDCEYAAAIRQGGDA